jgi:hypothetical protein
MDSERREFARNLRKHPTRAEDILSERLRSSRFHGAKFRRQVPFGCFVVDFYCHDLDLVLARIFEELGLPFVCDARPLTPAPLPMGRGIAFEQRGLNGQKKGILEEAPDSREA